MGLAGIIHRLAHRRYSFLFRIELGLSTQEMAERGEMLFGTISLNTARSAGDAGLGVEGKCVLNG